MEDNADVGVYRGEAGGGGIDFGRADGGGVVEELALEVVFLDVVEIGEAKRADAGGGEVEGGGAAQAAGADDEDAGGGELLLAGDADVFEEDVPAIARELGGREGGRRRGGHAAQESAERVRRN